MPSLLPAPLPAWLLALLLAACAIPSAAAAPSADTDLTGAAPRDFEIAAAPLGEALRQFAGQTGILLSSDASLTRDKRSPGLRARVSVEQGLPMLLAGSGLQAARQPDGSYILHPAPAATAPSPPPQPLATAAPAPRVLPKIVITGALENGYGDADSSAASNADVALRDTPQSVSVISKQLLRDQTMQSMADVLRYIPGVVSAQGEGNRDTAVFRGNSSAYDFYIDGIRDDVQYFRDFYNIDSVEAYKGANALSFGRGGSGGVINRVAKQANWNNQREASLTLGSWQNRRATLDVDQALDERWALRLNAMAEDSNSFRDGVSLKRNGVNPTVAWRAGAHTVLRFGFEHFDDQRTTDRGVPSYQGRPFPTAAGAFFGVAAASPTSVRINAFSATLDHDFGGGLTLSNRSRFAGYDKFYQNVFPGAVSADGGEVALRAYNNATRRKNLYNQTNLNATLSSGAVQHKLAAGLELGRQETDNVRNTGYFLDAGADVTSILVPTAAPTTALPVTFQQQASDARNHGTATLASLYLQDQIVLSPRWQAMAGLRYDSFHVDFLNQRDGSRLRSSDDPLSPRLGLVYKPLPALSLYASYSLTYVPRAGDQLASLDATRHAFDPEKFTNYEVGAKWALAPALAASAAVYYLDRNNLVIRDPSDVARSLLVDGQRSKGVELGLSGNISPAWSVMGGYAWQDARISGTRSATALGGARLAQVPAHSFSLWNRYDLDPVWGLGMGLVYSSRIYTSTSNAVSLPAFGRVDAAVYWKPNPRWRVQLNLENALSTRYYGSANSDDNISPGSPRAIRLGLTSKF